MHVYYWNRPEPLIEIGNKCHNLEGAFSLITTMHGLTKNILVSFTVY